MVDNRPLYVVGISAYYHDAAAVLLVDDHIVAAAHEERFTRKKHDASFPHHAIQYCLSQADITMSEVDAVVFYEKPLLTFERLLETYLVTAPHGMQSFISAVIVWIKEKLFLKRTLKNELQKISIVGGKQVALLFSTHHLSHAASAFFPSPFSEAAIVTIDGVGEWATLTIGTGEGNTVTIQKELHFPHSLGLLYSAFTYYLGFKVNSGEYKLMGLAPYGNPNSERVERFKKTIYKNLINLKKDGSVRLAQQNFTYATGLHMVDTVTWERLFGVVRRNAEDPLLQEHMDLALAIQQVTEEVVLRVVEYARQFTKKRNLCLAGGVALNCVANARVYRAHAFDDVWIQPAAGDAGGALGAAYAARYGHFKKKRRVEKCDRMQGALLGPSFSHCEIEIALSKYHASYERLVDDELYTHVANLLAHGAVVGWFQGRMEWGPRALGNRSILGDARDATMQKRLNVKIKKREGFRPFAPIVLVEDAREYFELAHDSPYMLFVASVQKKRQRSLPRNYYDEDWKTKLYYERSNIPAVTHIDYSARLQTVHQRTNPRLHTLLRTFKNVTGCSVLVNTSFNVRGEPIVCTPDDAYLCFMQTDMDYLVLENCILKKADQPPLALQHMKTYDKD